MEAEEKAMYEKVLAHQLEGIMLHFDLMNMYFLFSMTKMCRIHYWQLMDENALHAETNMHIIKETGTILHSVVNATAARSAFAKITAAPTSLGEKLIQHEQAVAAWLAWEEKTTELYQQMAEKYPDCKFWKKISKKVEKELSKVKFIKNKVLQ